MADDLTAAPTVLIIDDAELNGVNLCKAVLALGVQDVHWVRYSKELSESEIAATGRARIEARIGSPRVAYKPFAQEAGAVDHCGTLSNHDLLVFLDLKAGEGPPLNIIGALAELLGNSNRTGNQTQLIVHSSSIKDDWVEKILLTPLRECARWTSKGALTDADESHIGELARAIAGEGLEQWRLRAVDDPVKQWWPESTPRYFSSDHPSVLHSLEECTTVGINIKETKRELMEYLSRALRPGKPPPAWFEGQYVSETMRWSGPFAALYKDLRCWVGAGSAMQREIGAPDTTYGFTLGTIAFLLLSEAPYLDPATVIDWTSYSGGLVVTPPQTRDQAEATVRTLVGKSGLFRRIAWDDSSGRVKKPLVKDAHFVPPARPPTAERPDTVESSRLFRVELNLDMEQPRDGREAGQTLLNALLQAWKHPEGSTQKALSEFLRWSSIGVDGRLSGCCVSLWRSDHNTTYLDFVQCPMPF